MFVQPAPHGHIHFTANDRFHSSCLCRYIKENCAEEIAMVGDRNRRLFEQFHMFDQRSNQSGAVEQAVGGVRV